MSSWWRVLGLVALSACGTRSPSAVSDPGPAPSCKEGDTLTCECFDGNIGRTQCVRGKPGDCVCDNSSNNPPVSEDDDLWGDLWDDAVADGTDDEPPTDEPPTDGGGEDAPMSGSSCLAGTSKDYKGSGPYTVKTKQLELGGELGTYTLYYPDKLEASCPHPFVAWANGSGVTGATTYAHLQRHAASWGIVVIASHEPNAASKPVLERGLDWLLKDSERGTGDLKGKLGKAAGVAGHGQGGTAAVKATAHASVRAVVNIQGEGVPDPEAALLCATGVKDSARAACTDSYEKAQGPAFLADHQDADRTSTPTTLGARTAAGLEYTRLYTAWFRCFLAEDGSACALFKGEKAAPVCSQSTYATCEGKGIE